MCRRDHPGTKEMSGHVPDMNTTSSPLDHPASIPVVRRLLAAQALTAQEAEAMERQLRRDLPWKTWLDRSLLSLGVVLILTGIGYFFAHNWKHLTDEDKLVLAGGAVLACLLGATWAGLERFAGKLLLLAAGALVGVYLAVFGQIYQLANADGYKMCIEWAVLIFPWVVLGRFMPLWIFWLGLLNLAFGFYWPFSSFLESLDDWNIFRHVTISLLLLNGGALLLRESAGRWPLAWFDRGWSTLLLLLATIIPGTVETIGEILYTWDSSSSSRSAFIACGLYAMGVIGLGLFYSRWRYSLPALAIITLGACTVLTVLTIRFLDFDQADLSAGTWLIGGLIVLAIFGGGVFFLRSQRLAHRQD
jgi:uncharacterized membrane protein